jgi:hypothetical protein
MSILEFKPGHLYLIKYIDTGLGDDLIKVKSLTDYPPQSIICSVLATQDYRLNDDYYLGLSRILSAVEVPIKELPLYLNWRAVSREIAQMMRDYEEV